VFVLCARSYFYSRRFMLDALALLPVDVICLFLLPDWWACWRLPRVLRLPRLFSAFRDDTLLRNRNISSSHSKMAKQLFLFGVLAHWLGCLYFFLGDRIEGGLKDDGEAHVTWLHHNHDVEKIQHSEDVAYHQYILCLYWACAVIARPSIGEQRPQRWEEVVFCLCAMFVAIVAYALVFANVSEVMMEAVKSKRVVEFRAHVRWLNLYRRTCQIDPVLEKRLLRCAVAPHELHAPHSAHRSDTPFPPQQSRRRQEQNRRVIPKNSVQAGSAVERCLRDRL
jgi:hypothetical protein